MVLTWSTPSTTSPPRSRSARASSRPTSSEGEHTTIELAEGEAFGQRNPEMVQRVALKLMRELGDADETWSVGDVVQFPTPDGTGGFTGVLRELDPQGEWALFDFNHPLAGQRVTFEVKLIGVL